MITCVVVGVGDRKIDSYASYIKKSGIAKIIGVAEPEREARESFKTEYNISDDMCFENYEALFSHEKIADACIICASDKMYLALTRMAVECGYHIMLENPASLSLFELEKSHIDAESQYTTDFNFDSDSINAHVGMFNEIREHISNSLERNWSLEDMSALAGYSVSHFSYLYKQIFKISPKSDLLHLRMNMAKTLLTQTNMSIAQMILKLGFSSVNNFSYTFKKHVGMTPSEYRHSSVKTISK